MVKKKNNEKNWELCEKYTANNLQRSCANEDRTLRYNTVADWLSNYHLLKKVVIFIHQGGIFSD